jgi:hypothetical protein
MNDLPFASSPAEQVPEFHSSSVLTLMLRIGANDFANLLLARPKSAASPPPGLPNNLPNDFTTL